MSAGQRRRGPPIQDHDDDTSPFKLYSNKSLKTDTGLFDLRWHHKLEKSVDKAIEADACIERWVKYAPKEERVPLARTCTRGLWARVVVCVTAHGVSIH